MLNKKILYSIILLIILIGGAYYFYNEFQRVSNSEQKESRVLGDVKINSNQNIESEGSYTIETIPVKNSSSIVAPNLDKKIVFDKNTPEEIKSFTTKQIKNLSKKLKEDKTLFSAWLDLASFRKSIGNYQEAEKIWKYTMEVWPQSPIPPHNLGDLYQYYLRDYPKSEKYFLQALKNDPQQIITYRALYDLYTLSYKEKENQADDILLRGLKNNSNHVDLLVPLAAYYAEKGEVVKAKDYYQQAIKEAQRLKNKILADSLQKELNKIK